MSLLSDFLRTKLIPWSQHNVAERFVVGRPKMSPLEMPNGVQLSSCSIVGPRIVVKKARFYNNTRGVIANWPEARLNEVPNLKLAGVINGHANFQIGNYFLQCGAGNFIFIPPGMPHPMSLFPYVDTEKSTFCDVLYFGLLPHALQCWINHSRVGQRIQTESNSLILDEHIIMLFRVLMEKVIAGEEDSLSVGESLFPIFLRLLLREIDNGHFQLIRGDNPDEVFQKSAMDSQRDDFASRLEHYVQANLHKPLTLEKVSQEMYLSRSQFTFTVRRETGKSFNQFLVEHRIEAAKQALVDSQWTISAIAKFVGFASPSYFRTVFRKCMGQTPTQFRDQNRPN